MDMSDETKLKPRSFIYGDPQIATERDLKARWSGGAPGENFRCYLCGYRFQLGDYWRCQYTNDMSDAGGNPKVCKECDGSREDVRAKWEERCAEFYSDKFWALRGD